MRELSKNPRFAKYLPTLEPQQLVRLKESLLSDPTSEPVIYWTQTDNILDGHNRYDIALECGVELQTHGKDFDSEDEALYWIIRNQTTKRNLDTPTKNQVLRDAVSLEIKIEGKSKAEAIASVSESSGASRSAIYEAIAEPKRRIAEFKQSRKDLEAAINRRKEKALAGLKGLPEDEAADKWQQIEADLQLEIEALPEFEAVQEQGLVVQELIAEAPHLRRELNDNKGGGGCGKEATARRLRAGYLKVAASLSAKLLDAYADITQIVDVKEARAEVRTTLDCIEVAQMEDAKEAKQRKFGKKKPLKKRPMKRKI